jgi:phosphoenolpyruvate carboxylase
LLNPVVYFCAATPRDAIVGSALLGSSALLDATQIALLRLCANRRIRVALQHGRCGTRAGGRRESTIVRDYIANFRAR